MFSSMNLNSFLEKDANGKWMWITSTGSKLWRCFSAFREFLAYERVNAIGAFSQGTSTMVTPCWAGAFPLCARVMMVTLCPRAAK